MITTLQQSRNFILLQQVRKTNGKKYYRITTVSRGVVDLEKVRDIVDPTRGKSGRYGRSWKFINRAEAEKYYIMLILQWGN